jgi:phosphate transport system substrate-binding protein
MKISKHIFRNNLLFILCFALLVSSCGNENNNNSDDKELEGRITISGAFALYPLVVKWGEEFQKLHPKVKVDVNAGGAGKGIADALHDNVNLGMVSREVRQEEISAGAWGVTVARDAVLPTVNSKNPFLAELVSKGLTKEKFYKIWVTEEIKTWGEALGNGSKELIRKYKRSDASGAGETWAKFLDKNPDDLKGIGVLGDPGVAYAVIKDQNAIAFNNIAYVYDLKTQHFIEGLAVVPIDLNGNGKIDSIENFYNKRADLIKAIAHNKYPSPPGRDLYFISNGPPKDKLVLEFFKWILTDGQKFVPEMGYLKLSPQYVAAEVDILNSFYPLNATVK